MSELDLALIFITGTGALAAGLVSTLAGMGGGIILITLLSLILPLRSVVPLTAPVFLISGATRTVLYRAEIDRPVIAWFVLGAVPTVASGAFLLAAVPETWLNGGLGILLLLFVLFQAAGGNERLEPGRFLSPGLFTLVGAATGLVSAVVGGGGLVIGPFLLARGLIKESFVGTMAAAGTTLNVVKLLVFLGSGMLALAHLPASLAAALMITVGNVIGRTLLDRISEDLFRELLLAALAILALRLFLSL